MCDWQWGKSIFKTAIAVFPTSVPSLTFINAWLRSPSKSPKVQRLSELDTPKSLIYWEVLSLERSTSAIFLSRIGYNGQNNLPLGVFTHTHTHRNTHTHKLHYEHYPYMNSGVMGWRKQCIFFLNWDCSVNTAKVASLASVSVHSRYEDFIIIFLCKKFRHQIKRTFYKMSPI
jgi:hypothetical protein